MILEQKFFWRIFRSELLKFTYILPRFSEYTYTINKKIAKIKFSLKFFCKLKNYVSNSPGIVLYALGTTYSCLN